MFIAFPPNGTIQLRTLPITIRDSLRVPLAGDIIGIAGSLSVRKTETAHFLQLQVPMARHTSLRCRSRIACLGAFGHVIRCGGLTLRSGAAGEDEGSEGAVGGRLEDSAFAEERRNGWHRGRNDSDVQFDAPGA